MAAFDFLIAPTATEHGLALVTRNVRDFVHAPVVLLNPWTDAYRLMRPDCRLVVSFQRTPRPYTPRCKCQPPLVTRGTQLSEQDSGLSLISPSLTLGWDE